MQTCGVGDTGEESKLTQLEVACVPGTVLGDAGDPEKHQPSPSLKGSLSVEGIRQAHMVPSL